MPRAAVALRAVRCMDTGQHHIVELTTARLVGLGEILLDWR